MSIGLTLSYHAMQLYICIYEEFIIVVVRMGGLLLLLLSFLSKLGFSIQLLSAQCSSDSRLLFHQSISTYIHTFCSTEVYWTWACAWMPTGQALGSSCLRSSVTMFSQSFLLLRNTFTLNSIEIWQVGRDAAVTRRPWWPCLSCNL